MRIAFLSAAPFALALAACAPSGERKPAPVVYQGTAPSGQTAAPAAQAAPPAEIAAPVKLGEPDGRGVVLYDGYETIRARRGDTVQAMASRVGLTGSELAAYNGLSTLYQPGEGDELVLPARPDRYRGAVVAAAPQPAIQEASQPATGSSQSAIPPTYQPSVGEAGAESDQVALAPTATAQPAAEPAQSESGWSAARARAAIFGAAEDDAAPEPSATAAPEPVAAPEPTVASVIAPQPESQPQVAAAPEPAAAQAQAAATQDTQVALAAPEPASAGAKQFIRPTTAPVARPFSKAPGPNRNDGVDYATAAGDPVAAADDGAVALISKSLGGLGTIVLIRHDNQFLTVYGRVDGVTVRKGDRVSRGQVIAQVADLKSPRNPHLHFEIRKGAESVDPEAFY